MISACAWLALKGVIGRDGRWAAAVLAVGTAFITFGALVALAVPQVTEAHQRRVDALTPRIDLSEASPVRSSLQTFDPSVDLERRWNGHEIKRTYFAGRDGLAIPGLSGLPAEGAFAASPALQRLIESDEVVADLYRGKRLVATIDDGGLVHPHELRSVERAAPDLPLMFPVTGFGPSAGPSLVASDGNEQLNAVVGVVAAITVALPAALLLWIVTRLSAPSRRRTSLLLRRVGLSRRSTWLVAATGGAAVSIPAAIIGCVAYNVAAGRVTAIPGTAFGFFPADVSIAPSKQAITCLVLVLISVLAFTVAGGARDEGRVRRRWLPLGLRVCVAALGIGLLLLTPVLVRVVGPNVGFTIWAGIGLTSLGFVLVSPALVRALSDAWAAKARSGGALVGSRLLVSHRSALDVAGLLGVCVILYLGSLSFMSILQGGQSDDWDARVGRHSHVPFVVNDLADRLTTDRIRDADPDARTVVLSESKEGAPIVYGSCEDLRGISGERVEGCAGRVHRIVVHDEAADVPAGTVTLGDGTVMPSGPSVTPVHVGNVPPEFDGALLVGAEHAPAAGDSATFYVVLPAPHLVASMARIPSAAPLAQFDLGELDYHNPAVNRFPTQLACIALAASVGLAIAALGVGGLVASEGRLRSRQLRGLRILGAPRGQLLLAHSIGTVGAFVVLGLASLLLGAVVAWAFTSIDGRAYVAVRPYLVILGSLAVLSILVTWATWRDARRVIGRSSGIAA